MICYSITPHSLRQGLSILSFPYSQQLYLFYFPNFGLNGEATSSEGDAKEKALLEVAEDGVLEELPPLELELRE